jgi:tetratricopeptide (TPR) repeat protein
MRNHPDLDHLKKNYFGWLTDSGQEEEAGRWKEEERDYVAAISLYLKGGLPGKAAHALKKAGLTNNIELNERVAAALLQSGLYEQAGNLYEQINANAKALDAYRRGKTFKPAIDLCRVIHPEQVVILEEQWGDYLVIQKQMDTAISHYIEAGKMLKAVDAAVFHTDCRYLQSNSKKHHLLLIQLSLRLPLNSITSRLPHFSLRVKILFWLKSIMWLLGKLKTQLICISKRTNGIKPTVLLLRI